MLLVTATTLLVLLAFLLPLTLLLRTLAVDRAVAEATKEAQNLAVLVAVADPAQLASAVTLINERGPRQIGLVLAPGQRIGATDRGTPASLALAEAGRSFTAAVPGGRQVYVPVDTSSGRAVVRSFVPDRVLHRGVAAATGILVSLGAGLLVLAVIVADRLAAGTVRPMKALAQTALALSDGQLDARVVVGGPTEVKEVGHALNVLAQRIGELLDAEREAVADLSHRLRTPLTALRLDSEALPPSPAAARVAGDLDDLHRAIDAVIREARRPVREGVNPSCDAGEVVAERAAFWGVLMEDQGRAFDVTVVDPLLPVKVSAEDLRAAVDAVLQNALVHTPEGTTVWVRVTAAAAGRTEVRITDDGAGLPPLASERGRSGAGSTGLGLDIVRRTAEASGGSLRLTTADGSGACVLMTLGPAM